MTVHDQKKSDLIAQLEELVSILKKDNTVLWGSSYSLDKEAIIEINTMDDFIQLETGKRRVSIDISFFIGNNIPVTVFRSGGEA